LIPVPDGLNGGFAGLAGTNANDLVNSGHKNLSVTDFSRV
jgi:hypothetical protein